MTNVKTTKKALLMSAVALLLCFAMLLGTTFAWFTDSATSAVNTIQAGNLDIVLEYSIDGTTWTNAENKTLDFKTADNRTTGILWEPGCTYELPAIRVRNNGSLALKYQIVINGVTGNAKLLEAIEFTANGNAISNFVGHLDTNGAASEAIVIKGHMKEDAGNEYQGLSIEGIGITVYATQFTYEDDSFGNKYDQMGDGMYTNGTFAAGSINSGRTMGNNGRYQIAADLTNVSGVKTLAVNVLDQYGKLMTTITPEGYQIPADGKIASTTVAAVVVGNSSSWQNTAFVPTMNIVPTTMELVVNGAVIGVTDVKPLANASPVTWAEIVDAYYVANNVAVVDSANELNAALKDGKDTIVLGSGDYVIPASAQNKTLTIVGNGSTTISIPQATSYEGCDYFLSGSNVTFENVVITTNSSTYTGYAGLSATYKNCTFNGTYHLYGDSVFENCTFNISGDAYNLWTWAAPNVKFINCTFNSDGKALLLYGGVNTKMTVEGCTFNDNGGLTDKKAAIEIGNDYGMSYELIVNNTTVNGYEINDKGISTGTTLWGNKNSMGTDKLNVVVDGVDVY